MLIKGLVDEDFVNYKKPSMYIIFPFCSFKCDKECGSKVCQNSTLATAETIDITTNELVERYINNTITSAIVFGGLEPFDSFNDLVELIKKFREKTNDDIVIYTGFNMNEIENKIEILKRFKNVIVKFGRFIPNQEPHFDNVLGVKLASDNQKGVVIC